MAAKDLKVQLSIDGARQVASAFQEVGQAAKNASSQITSAFNNAAIDNKFTVALNNLKNNFSKFGGYLKNVGNEISNVEQNLIRFTSRIGVLTGAFVGLGTAFGFATNNIIKNSSDLVDNANSVGISASKYAELEFIFGQVGLSSEKFRMALVKINDIIPEASNRSTDLGKKLSSLGVNAKDPINFLYQLLDATKKLGTEQKKIAFLSDVLGPKIGPRLAEAAGIGSKSLKDFAANLREKGIFPTDKELKTLEDTGDSITAFGRALDFVKIKLLALLGPTISQIFDTLTNAIINNKDKIINWADSKIKDAAEWVQAAINVFSGGAYIESDKTERIRQLRDQFIQFASDLNYAYQTIKTIFSGITTALNFTFGTNFSPAFLAALLILGRLTGAFTLLYSVISLGYAIFGPLITYILTTVASVVSLGAAFYTLAAFIGGGLLGTAIVALIYLLYQNLEIIKVSIYNFISSISLSISKLLGTWVLNFLTSILQVQTLWSNLLLIIQSAIYSAAQNIVNAWNIIITFLYKAWESFINYFSQSISNALISSLSNLNQISQVINEYIIIPLQNSVSSIVGVFQELGNSIYNALTNGLNSAYDSVVNIVNGIISWVQSAINYVNSLIQAAYAAAAAIAGVGGSGYASGGYVRGSGTSISDSIPAWLSNGEFVIRAAAVRKYGLGLFQQLNGLNISDSIRQGFAMGGLVGIPSPSLAMASSGGRAINLTIGNELFSMNASDEVAQKLIKYAHKRNASSPGKKPAWYGS